VLKEFKKFALKGNVVDMAVGVIIGGAFGKIVTSIVNDMVMPLLGLVMGRVNFSGLFILLGTEPLNELGQKIDITTIEQAASYNIPTFNYGQFLTNVLDFLIIAFSIFLIIKLIGNLGSIKISKKGLRKKKAEEPAPTTKICPFCCLEIPIDAVRCGHCTSELEECLGRVDTI